MKIWTSKDGEISGATAINLLNAGGELIENKYKFTYSDEYYVFPAVGKWKDKVLTTADKIRYNGKEYNLSRAKASYYSEEVDL